MLSMSGPEELQEHWDRVHLSTPATVPMSEEDQHLEVCVCVCNCEIDVLTVKLA